MVQLEQQTKGSIDGTQQNHHLEVTCHTGNTLQTTEIALINQSS